MTDRSGTPRYPTVHILKTWPRYFDDVESGGKTFEIRKNDRGFQVGDVLLLREWDPLKTYRTRCVESHGDYTGRQLQRRVTYLAALGECGMPDYVGMSIEPV